MLEAQTKELLRTRDERGENAVAVVRRPDPKGPEAVAKEARKMLWTLNHSD